MSVLSHTVIFQPEPITNTSSTTLTIALLNSFRFAISVIFFLMKIETVSDLKKLAFVVHLIHATLCLGLPMHYYLEITITLGVEIVAILILQLRELSVKKLNNHLKVSEVITGRVGTQSKFDSRAVCF